jgi:hypothetical protein
MGKHLIGKYLIRASDVAMRSEREAEHKQERSA